MHFSPIKLTHSLFHYIFRQRAGLYLELANLRDIVNEYKTGEISSSSSRSDLREAIWASCERAGITADVPLLEGSNADMELNSLSDDVFDSWVAKVSTYLTELEERLFSSGLHTLGKNPTDKELSSYLNAYFGKRLTEEEVDSIITSWHQQVALERTHASLPNFLTWIRAFARNFMGEVSEPSKDLQAHFSEKDLLKDEAMKIVNLLCKNTEEIDSVLNALNGGYVRPAPGGDLLRDGTSVLPTGRNIHALDPYRMPSAGAWTRGERAVKEIIRQHKESNDGAFPETVAVTLWGLDTIKTRGKEILICYKLFATVGVISIITSFITLTSIFVMILMLVLCSFP